MNNDRKIFEEISAFLVQSNKPVVIVEAVKPFTESRLHLLETAEIRTELNEARASQHLLKQFSATEIAHIQFVAEAVSVLEYRAANEGVRKVDETTEVQEAKDWDEGNSEPGNNFAIFINGKKWKVLPGPRGAKADSPAERKEFDRLRTMAQNKTATTGKKWEVRITGEKITESEELDELSTALLGKYKSAAGKAASAADAVGDYKTGNKRFSGIMKATKKQFANDAKELKQEADHLKFVDEAIEVLKYKSLQNNHNVNQIVTEGDVVHFPQKHPWYAAKTCPKCEGSLVGGKTADGRVKYCMGCGAVYPEPNTNKAARDDRVLKKESEELDELSARTLGSYVKKATVDVAQNSFNSGRKVHEPKEYHKSKQAAKSRIQGVMRAATKLSKNENTEPTNRALWTELVEQARTEFDSYPSIASASWVVREYTTQGGKWMVEDAE